MNVNAYFNGLTAVSEATEKSETSTHDFIEEPGSLALLIKDMVAFRKATLSAQDRERLTPYVEAGLLDKFYGDERLAAIAVSFDVGDERSNREARRECKRYESSQALFQNDRRLLDNIRRKASGSQDFELIDAKKVTPVGSGGVYRSNRGYAKLSPSLSPTIPAFASANWPDKPTFVRLDPDFFSATPPAVLLTEGIVSSINPTWWKDFSLRKGTASSAYELDNPTVADGAEKYWDYWVKDLRRLEVAATRREKNYLSIMIEELPSPDRTNGLMIARCVHLDTLDPAFTPPGKVKLQHLDLAINVYEGETRKARYAQSLREGKVVDASFRTHLFRIEDVPFHSLFAFCALFLKSERTLFSEWLNDLATV